MNGADILCETLLVNGVNVCFANPGTSEMHFVAALDRRRDMRCVLGLFEGIVTGAADGYARMTGKPAVTLLHTGPGLANGLANLHNARRAQVPVINVVGDHARHHLAFDAPLTTDIEGLAGPMSNWVYRVTGPGDVAASAGAAFLASMRPPQVATLILPADAAWGAVETAGTFAVSLPRSIPIDETLIARAATLLKSNGRRAGILLSGSASYGSSLRSAGRIAMQTGARLLCPVLASRVERGRDLPSLERIPYPVDLAVEALKDLTVLLLVGAVEPVAFFAYPGKPSRLLPNSCRVVRVAAHGCDMDASMDALLSAVGNNTSSVRHQPASAIKVGHPTGALTEDAVAVVLGRLMPEHTIVVDEALTSARRFYPLTFSGAVHDYLMIPGGSIGGGIPLAVGAAIACPNRKVVLLQADGSGMYTLQGLWTAAREKLDIVTVIFANRVYAILQAEMRNVGVSSFGYNAERMLRIDDPDLNWVKLAEGMGVEAERVTSVERFADCFAAAIRRKGPYLIEALI